MENNNCFGELKIYEKITSIDWKNNRIEKSIKIINLYLLFIIIHIAYKAGIAYFIATFKLSFCMW